MGWLLLQGCLFPANQLLASSRNACEAELFVFVKRFCKLFIEVNPYSNENNSLVLRWSLWQHIAFPQSYLCLRISFLREEHIQELLDECLQMEHPML